MKKSITYIKLGLSANISCTEKIFDVDFYCLPTLRQQLDRSGAFAFACEKLNYWILPLEW